MGLENDTRLHPALRGKPRKLARPRSWPLRAASDESRVGSGGKSLRHFDSERYMLDDFVVMPNHVHAIVKPVGDHALSEILHSWKSFSANAVNRALGQDGAVWMEESFDTNHS